ncbi:MAG: HAD-IC family P-type ATPase [Clostridia bacterium]|nr:HAD-IC family P-type ATPase [Clostridia bacterium]
MRNKEKKNARLPVTRRVPDPAVGLTQEEAALRKKNGWSNVSSSSGGRSAGQIVVKNVFTFFNCILFAIAVVFAIFITYLYSSGNGAVVEKHFGFSKFLFLIPAALNIIIGTAQELHSKKIIDALRLVNEIRCRVLRDGKAETIPASRLVIDDVVLLSAGDQATADLQILSGELSVDESMLTGESDPVKKAKGDTVLSGSAVTVGEARAVVTAVGNDTYASGLVKKVKSVAAHRSELMDTIYKIIRTLTVVLAVVETVVIATLCVKIALHGNDASVFDGMTLSLSDPVTWARIMITGGSFGVGLIPQGLVLTTSVTLMLSIVSLSRKETLIRELYSLENLSRVDVICLDKTGTLTDGTMEVEDVKSYAHLEDVIAHVQALLAASESRNPTAEALFAKFGAAKTPSHREYIPFSSAEKRSGIVYEDGRTLCLGAPEYLLPHEDERLEYVRARAAEGKRVVAMTLDGILLAFFVLGDRIRKSAPDTLKFFKENGVTVKVISGDNPLTVSKIAGICGVENADKAISLEGVPLEKIDELAEEYTVFARVSPEQKEALIIALQKRKHKVAMTGDGVNDILALRRCDSSITFSKATEAAKSCADVVLLDNDFAHLKDVVGEGRRVISNVQRTAVLFLMKSIAIAVVAFALIPFEKGQFWFSIENAYMFEAAVIGIGGFLLSLEYKKTPTRGSFMKNIAYKAFSAGALAAAAILTPIIFYNVPVYFGHAPLMMAENVRTMMTVLLALAGIVVIAVTCVPFTKYRLFTLFVVISAAVLMGMALPTSYIGGHPTGAGMFAYDASSGQTFMDCVFMREFFRPWNSEAVRLLTVDRAILPMLKLFLCAAIPLFIILNETVSWRIEKDELGNAPSLFTPRRIAGTMLLISGGILTFNSFISAAEALYKVFSSGSILSADSAGRVFSFILIGGIFALNVFMALTAYRLWRTGARKYIRRASVLAIAVLLILGMQIVLWALNAAPGGALPERTTNIIIDLISSLLFLAGAGVFTAQSARGAQGAQ